MVAAMVALSFSEILAVAWKRRHESSCVGRPCVAVLRVESSSARCPDIVQKDCGTDFGQCVSIKKRG